MRDVTMAVKSPGEEMPSKKCSVDLDGVEELRGPGYNGESAMHLNNDVNKRPVMPWHGTYCGLCHFLLWRIPGRVRKAFQNHHTYQKWLEATRRRGKENGGLVFYLLLGGWCLCLPCDPHSLPVISRAQEVCDLWITVK